MRARMGGMIVCACVDAHVEQSTPSTTFSVAAFDEQLKTLRNSELESCLQRFFDFNEYNQKDFD